MYTDFSDVNWDIIRCLRSSSEMIESFHQLILMADPDDLYFYAIINIHSLWSNFVGVTWVSFKNGAIEIG